MSEELEGAKEELKAKNKACTRAEVILLPPMPLPQTFSFNSC